MFISANKTYKIPIESLKYKEVDMEVFLHPENQRSWKNLAGIGKSWPKTKIYDFFCLGRKGKYRQRISEKNNFVK